MSNGRFSTSVYRKPPFTVLFTNFHSLVLSVYKRYFVCCLLHRIFHLCSSYENFHNQLKTVRKLLDLDGCPTHMFDQLVRRFLNNLFKPKPPVFNAPKKILHFCFHCLSLAHISFNLALKSHDFAVLLRPCPHVCGCFLKRTFFLHFFLKNRVHILAAYSNRLGPSSRKR